MTFLEALPWNSFVTGQVKDHSIFYQRAQVKSGSKLLYHIMTAIRSQTDLEKLNTICFETFLVSDVYRSK